MSSVTSDLVRTSRTGIVTDHDNYRDSYHSYLESKVAISNENKATKEGFSQTEFSDDMEQEIVLGQYLEHKLGPDLKEFKVRISSTTDNHLSETHRNVASKQQFSNTVPEIFIVEYEEQEEEII